MRRRSLIISILCLAPALFLTAQENITRQKEQETEAFDWDIDSVFDEPPPGEADSGEEAEKDTPLWQRDILSVFFEARGFSMDVSYHFLGGYAPGWSEAPWYQGDYETEYGNNVGAEMTARLDLDFHISKSLRVKNAFSFSVPELSYSIEEFFFDYNLNNRAFIRGGKYLLHWGVSPNFPFTDLPARVPANSSGGESYLAKVDIPIGIGGLQLLVMTRSSYVQKAARLTLEEIAYGTKYNLAFRWADIDLGVLYFQNMPLRGFYSVKSTLGNTEVYTEGLAAFDYKPWEYLGFSASAGFVQGLFGDKLTINGEFFYNGESDAAWFRPKNEIKNAEVTSLIEGINGALNLSFRPGWYGFRFFTQCLYSFKENSAQLVPGLSFTPASHITITLAVPMALGSRDGSYYRSNADIYNRPFSIMLGMSVDGTYRFSRYEE
ncbi:hypothetical protein FACS189468_2000 [Spirochaetia bacterium]|nr:hypothetical protein FACS189468_2000 [Spirochaetia bacterium]